MTVPDLLADLRTRGVVLSINEGRLAYDAPVGAMTPDVVAALKAHKPALLAALATTKPQGRETGALPPEPPKASASNPPLPLSALLAAMPPHVAAELQYLFDEQAARLEYDSGLSRDNAEQLTLEMLAGIVESLAGGGA